MLEKVEHARGEDVGRLIIFDVPALSDGWKVCEGRKHWFGARRQVAKIGSVFVSKTTNWPIYPLFIFKWTVTGLSQMMRRKHGCFVPNWAGTAVLEKSSKSENSSS